MILADVLARHRSAIVDRFVRSMRDAGLGGDDARRSELMLHVPFFLADLEEALRATDADQFEPPASTTARAHGRARYRLGFDLGGLVREYGLLRHAIVAVASENGVDLGAGEFEVVATSVDLALAEAATEYALRRDAELVAERDALSIERARLEEAVKFRQDVVAIVSHDLRSPLTAMGLTVRQLRKLDPSASPEKRDGLLDTFGRSIDRMARLISDFLDVATIEAGTLKIDPAPTPAAALIGDALESVRPLAEQKNITVTPGTIDDDLLLLCDRERTLQVLANLLGNAVKFTPQGGRINVDLRVFGDDAQVSVHDTGPGIPLDQLEHVFDRFWQAPGGHRQGRGLGLAIARGIVEAHGRKLVATSEPGEGSTFTFSLPTVRAARAAS